MTDEEIRDRISQMVRDSKPDHFVERLQIVSQETVECGCCPPSVRVVFAMDLP